jgi:Family of unknown function (DUF6527)
MGLLSPTLRNGQDNALTWWCPGCDCAHSIKHGEGPGPRWGWNGSADKPTFTPSVLVRSGHHADGTDPATCFICKERRENPEDDHRGFGCCICHSFVIDGQMQMLSDCTHALAGQTVPIPPWPRSDE